MLLSLFEFLLWLQPAATSSGGGSSAGGGGAAGGGSQYCLMQAGIMAAVLAFTYFFMIRPEQKRRQEAEDLLKQLRKGMKVRTTSGILGEIISIDDRVVMLGIADKVKINVLRSQIAGPEEEPKPAESKDAKKEAESKASSEKAGESGKKPDDARS